MPNQPADIQSLNARAVRYSIEIVDQVRLGDLGRPTPCAGWTLADLLDHMTVQHHGFAAAADGHGQDLETWKVRPLGDDAVAEHRAAAELVLRAFAAPDVPARTFNLPEFEDALSPPDFPGALAMGFHFIDAVVHGWDVAKAIGVPFELDADLLAAAMKVAFAVPTGQARLKEGAAFKPVLAEADANENPTIDRILAFLGRSPRWPDA